MRNPNCQSSRCLILAFTIVLACQSAILVAQENLFAPTTTPPVNAGQAPPATIGQASQQKSFKEIMETIRKNEAEINRLYSSIPIGFPEVQKEHMAKIETMRANNNTLKGQLKSAAIQSYMSDPSGNQEAAKIVFDIISGRLDGNSIEGNFDPNGALEMADTMIRAGIEEATGIDVNDVAYQAFRASFAIQDFARAETILNQIEDSGLKLNPSIRSRLADARTKWERELMIRRLEANTNDLPRVKFETTEGVFVVELYENHAPQTVGNFINLVEKQYYDGLTFFTVRPGEYAQSGCRLNSGTSNAGYQIPCECYREQIRHHFAGTLSMVNRGKDTGGSQFFVAHQANKDFDGSNTAFGRVIEGLDVIYGFKKVNSAITNSEYEPTKIIKAEVIRKREHDYAPTRVAEQSKNKVGGLTPSGSLQTVQDNIGR